MDVYDLGVPLIKVLIREVLSQYSQWEKSEGVVFIFHKMILTNFITK